MDSSNADGLRNRLIEVAKTSHLTEMVQRLEKLAQNPGAGGIVLAGAFGRGKTTLLNALIGTTLLPVNSSPVDTYTINLHADLPVSLTGHYTTGAPKTAPTNADGVQQLFQSGKKLEQLELVLDVSFLPRHQSLVEVPGIGETNPTHSTLALAALAAAHSLIFVLDAVLDPTREELDFLRSVPSNIEKVLVVVNKIDLLDDKSESVKIWMNRISSLELTVPIEYFKVSAQEALAGTFIGDWASLVRQLEKLPRHEMSIPAIDLKELTTIASAMRQQLLASRQVPVEESPHQDRDENLAETRRLILNVIRDQSIDIRQTIQESLEATVYKLGSDLRSHSRS